MGFDGRPDTAEADSPAGGSIFLCCEEDGPFWLTVTFGRMLDISDDVCMSIWCWYCKGGGVVWFGQVEILVEVVRPVACGRKPIVVSFIGQIVDETSSTCECRIYRYSVCAVVGTAIESPSSFPPFFSCFLPLNLFSALPR